VPSGPEPDFGALPRSRNRHVNNSCVRTAANHNREKSAVKLGLISAAIFGFDLQPLNVSEIFLTYTQSANGISAIRWGDRQCFAA
jgi:hypothetical protein